MNRHKIILSIIINLKSINLLVNTHCQQSKNTQNTSKQSYCMNYLSNQELSTTKHKKTRRD